MEVHRNNQSKLLRRNASGECRYCGIQIEWFHRYDTQRIPLSPELPASRIPERFQWHVNRGVAYPGVDPRAARFCRVPHPVMCPALEHEDLTPELADVVARLAVRMRIRIERDGFIPAIPPLPGQPDDNGDGDGEPPGVAAPAVRVRHTLRYTGAPRLGPGPLEEVQCTARSEGGERCPNAVFVAGEGGWEMIDLPHLPGRSGQMILSATNGKMWVWSLTTVDFPVAARWLRQRCPQHDDDTPAFCRPEWQDFHPIRHSDFIVARRPEGYDPEPDPAGPALHDGPRKLMQCAETGCFNTTPAPMPEGWLCWRCSKLVKRRAKTHRRWQQPGPKP